MRKKISCLLLAWLLCSTLSYIYGQPGITGHIIDETGYPVAYATVYINGTSHGSRTSLEGNFEISHASTPCQLVVSHLGYETTNITINDMPNAPMQITLKEKTVQLSEISVIGKDKREVLYKEFRDFFLGTDTWGKGARLLNDSVLVLDLKYNEDTVLPTFDGILGNGNIPWNLVERSLLIRAREPLQIDLPLLGYEVMIDLDFFSLTTTKPYYYTDSLHLSGGARICKYLGSYYIKPYDAVSHTKQKKYERNRRDAFYNSKEHFCKALYHNELKKNGFILLESRVNPDTKTRELVPPVVDTCMEYDGKGTLKLIGLAGRSFQIHYFCKFNGYPIDLTKKTFSNVLNYFKAYEIYYTTENYSTISFLSDTCTILKNGVSPDTSIAFKGKCSFKKVGATLPDDYEPDENPASTKQ